MIRQLAWQAWERRRGFAADLLTVDDAIRQALAAEGGPFILSESADSTGSGSPGDSAHVLERLLALDVRERCLVTVVDAPAVARAIAAGVGAEVTTTVGGTLDPRYNRPVPLTGRVRILSDGRYISSDKKSLGVEFQMGRAAVIEVGRIAILATERPAFTFDPGALPLRRPRAAGREDRGGEVAAPVPRRLRRLRPGVLGRRHARAQHGARRAPRVASPLAPALPLRRRLRARDPRGRRGARRDSSVTGPAARPCPDLPLERRPLGLRRRGTACSTASDARSAGSSRSSAVAPTCSTSRTDSWASCSAATTCMRYALREEPIRRVAPGQGRSSGPARSAARPRSADTDRRLERWPALAAVAARPAGTLTEPGCPRRAPMTLPPLSRLRPRRSGVALGRGERRSPPPRPGCRVERDVPHRPGADAPGGPHPSGRPRQRARARPRRRGHRGDGARRVRRRTGPTPAR